MASDSFRRGTMSLFSDSTDPTSHQIRIVLAEKALPVDIIPVNPNEPPEDLAQLNPYGNTPTLIDRDLVLYDPNIIMEYLDERYPHPALLSVYPIIRAKTRLLMFRIQQDWYHPLKIILNDDKKSADKARDSLRDSLIEIAPAFNKTPFFMSTEFSLLDCFILPLLWRLPKAGIKLPANAKGLNSYAEKMFERRGFISSLSEEEKQMR
ncbi:MAG: stringent starvation protein [Gammaproteobacteria bacterium]|jgi:RNA polymerase-associated protein|nr:stringent starvation protein [Gammaproteobacteria bacterium]